MCVLRLLTYSRRLPGKGSRRVRCDAGEAEPVLLHAIFPSMPTKPILVIMAAGIGSRYGGFKQIEPVGPSGEIIIDYSMYDALLAGFERIVFIIHRDIEAPFREKMSRTVEKRAEVKYVLQSIDRLPAGCSLPAGRAKPWGTGHALLCAAGAIDAPSAVINADDFYGRRSYETLYRELVNQRDTASIRNYCMVAYVLGNTLTEHGHVARGVCTVGAEGMLKSIKECTRIEREGTAARYTEDGTNWLGLPAEALVSMNMWGFTPSYYAELEKRFALFVQRNSANLKAEFFLPTVVNELLEERKAQVKVLRTTEEWYGVTYREDHPVVQSAIHAMVKKGVYPADLWK
jgi:hypothetical protein